MSSSSMTAPAKSGGASGNPWAWLGLMKWTLEYADGTAPSSPNNVPMSAEDRAFLEKVMEEGIIDENERMKEILKLVTTQMESWKTRDKSGDFAQHEQDQVQDWLEELRDVVEQIDFSRAFQAMGGLTFLLGCVQQPNESIPRSTRIICLGLLATLCQHNPPLQKDLLERGSLGILSNIFFETRPEDDMDGQLRARTIQAVSANVRSHTLAESVFSQLEQANELLIRGLGPDKPRVLRQRTLFFLYTLVTSDTADHERIEKFSVPVVCSVDQNLLSGKLNMEETELRETTLTMVDQILEQQKNVNVVLIRRDAIVATAVQRVSGIRELAAEELQYAQVELGLWESILLRLAAVQEK